MTAPTGYSTNEPLGSVAPIDDRGMRAFRELVFSCLPQLAYLGLWQYRVDSIDGSNVVCSVDNPSYGLPSAVTAKVMPSILGEDVTLSVGSKCVLAFLNGDPSKPTIVGGDSDNPPMTATLLGGTKNAARVDDPVQIGTLSGGNTGGAVTFVFTPTTGAPVTAATVALSGSIMVGSAKVKVG